LHRRKLPSIILVFAFNEFDFLRSSGTLVQIRRGASTSRKRRGRLLFVNKKKQKNFIYAGPWALSVTSPMAQHNKNFCGAFFKKRPLSSLPEAGLEHETGGS
jgi:hypothetical protein